MGQSEIAKFLIENGGDVNATNDDEVILFIDDCSVNITRYTDSVTVNALP